MNEEELRIEEIGLWFQERGRKLILKELGDEGWEAIYAVHIPNVAVMAPGAFGKTRLQAAENAVAEYLEQPHESGNDPDPTPP
jgi:hypothetical protein